MGGDLESQDSPVILPCLFRRTQPQHRSLCDILVKPLALKIVIICSIQSSFSPSDDILSMACLRMTLAVERAYSKIHSSFRLVIEYIDKGENASTKI